MRVGIFSIVLASFLLAACGSKSPESSTPTSTSAVAALPVTLEGNLVADVGEGDGDKGGNSEYNFGDLTVNGEQIPIQVSGSVLQSAGFSGEASGKVRATISGKTDEFGPTVYTISALQRL